MTSIITRRAISSNKGPVVFNKPIRSLLNPEYGWLFTTTKSVYDTQEENT